MTDEKPKFKSPTELLHVVTEAHGKPLAKERHWNRYSRTMLCNKCGNDTFKMVQYDASCVCSEDHDDTICTKCGAEDSAEVFY